MNVQKIKILILKNTRDKEECFTTFFIRVFNNFLKSPATAT